jgi:hypothetical protein
MSPFPLLSNGPHEDLSPADRLFEPFIGSWDLDITWYDRGAVTRRAKGEWHFAWVLEGRAIQDVWVVPPREQRHGTDELYEYGTSIRFPDPSCGGWRSTWLGPMQRVVRTFLARPADGDVVLETRLEDGRPMHWRFSDITPTSCSWSNATEQDGEWIVTQRFTARRVPDTSLA